MTKTNPSGTRVKVLSHYVETIILTEEDRIALRLIPEDRVEDFYEKLMIKRQIKSPIWWVWVVDTRTPIRWLFITTLQNMYPEIVWALRKFFVLSCQKP